MSINIFECNPEHITDTYKLYITSQIEKYVKIKPISSYDLLAFVNTNNIDIGFIGLTFDNDYITVNTVQTPRICRMSILSLIDASFAILKKHLTPTTKILFENPSYAHVFKIEQLFPQSYKDVHGNIVVNSDDLIAIDLSLHTLKEFLIRGSMDE